MHSWRNRTAVSPERSPTEGTPLGCRSTMKVAETPHTTISYHHALVAQLDSVSASDAEGCGFDPRRVHQSPFYGGFCIRQGSSPWFARRRRRRTSRLRRSIPAGCTKAPFFGGFCIPAGVRTHRSPDAEGGAGRSRFSCLSIQSSQKNIYIEFMRALCYDTLGKSAGGRRTFTNF